MVAPDTLTLARQGDPYVIATLLNQVIGSKGIKAHVAKRDRCLHILLESAHTLNPKGAVAFLEKSINTLGVEAISTLKVYGRQLGQKAIAWNQEISLTWGEGSIPVTSSAEPLNAESSVSVSSASSTLESDSDLASSTNPSVTSIPVQTPVQPINPTAVQTAPSSDLSLSEAASSADLVSDTSQPPEDFNQSSETPDWLRRPEAIVLIIFVSVLMLWQMYLDLIDDIDIEKPVTGSELARRLGVNSSTISRRKERADFPAWSQDLDPDGIAWVYQDGMFVAKSE
ncbi:hypothetical protein H6G89_08765 [Oscillatoria sp. FACHB-1407]|uniref:hypothetical protein n=1 Tax=Oscillatoria sp. FACHB-1407 TaxID=2692847 RepID=UPI0016827839|nr:hypothetical protein [Oscillatoria sp. FACHB-1407]MBD2461133.1 hypothetical protein [Oscillatoria sp. FACHB-1407]